MPERSARPDHAAAGQDECDNKPDAVSAGPGRRQGGNLYLASAIFGQGAALIRYVALARLLGPEQLGLAATLVVTGAFFDLIADTGSDRFLIQDREGDTVPVQNLVQLVYILRGVAIAAALVIFSGPISTFYHQPRLAFGLSCMAVSPLILGFLHLDVRRAQRRLDFRPEAIGTIVGEAASLAATVLAAWLTRDFTAVLYGLIIRSIALVAASHFTAKRRYGIGWSTEHGPRLSRFSGPLMLAGLVYFIGSQGDRVMVANQLGAKALGEYSAVLLLIYYPAAVILKFMGIMYVPLLSGSRDDQVQRNRISDKLGGETLLLAVGMASGFAIVTPFMVTILYGQRFAQPALLIGMIGVLQATRFLIIWPTTVALSTARSVTVLLSNVSRLLVFPGAFIGLRLIGGLVGVISGFIFGELVSIAVALTLMNRNTERPILSGADRFGMFIAAGCLIVAWNLCQRLTGPLHLAAPVGMGLLTAIFIWRLAKTEFATLREAALLLGHELAAAKARLLRIAQSGARP